MSDADKARLDKWLFHARICRTRTAAQEAAARGRIRLNGTRVDKPGHRVRPGDILTVAVGGTVQALRILELAARRAPAPQARQLYEIVE